MRLRVNNSLAIKIKEISFAFIANLISMLISMIVTLLLPERLGVTDYSYFQLYIFYVGYVGLLHFGWADGIFLRYGGKYYEELDKSIFNGQLRAFSVFQVLVSAILFALMMLGSPQQDKKYVYICVLLISVFTNIKYFVQYILQGTGRIREYASMVIADKMVYIVLVIIFLLMEQKKFWLYIAAHMTGMMVSLVYGLWCCKDILQNPPSGLMTTWIEAKENIVSGIKLMIAQLSSQMIIGIVRQFIELQWSVETFGKVSLSLSISNLLMLLINAIAIVLFPLLRRMDKEKLVHAYAKIRSVLMVPMFIMMAFYYPTKVVLSWWLPNYVESLRYLALLFPMCVFESKMSMLVNTYLKTLRKEKIIMRVNLGVMTLSLLLSMVNVFLLKNLDLAVFSIVILLGIRSVIAEFALSRYLDVQVICDIIIEIMMVITFIVCSWMIQGLVGMGIYVLFVIAYCTWKRKEITNILKKVSVRSGR